LQAAGCTLSWCYPIKNVVKKRSIFFDEGVKAFMLKNCWNRLWSEICCYLPNLPNGW